VNAAAPPRDRIGGALLFVPAAERRLAKLPEIDADAVIVDLEDAIHADAKAEARGLAAAAIAALDRPDLAVLVRVNAAAEGGEEDLRALAGLPLAGLVIPKAADAATIEAVAAAVAERWPEGPPPLVPLIESAGGLVGLREMLAAGQELVPPVVAVALGAEDFAGDMEVARSDDGAEILLARQLIAVHAHAADIVAVDTPFLDSRDDEGLRRDAGRAAGLGFTGKLCIHPAQVPVVRAAFAPSEEQLEWARQVVAKAAEDDAAGEGVGSIDGRMLDRPVVIQAQRVLSRAGEGSEPSPGD
jgi:citrate lyase subunit beta / citryl-CoA lyase